MRRTINRIQAFFGCLTIIAVMSIIANAQFKGGVQGSVTDSAGAVVPGATITLTNKETGVSQQTVSSDGGFYRFTGLAPGTYTVTAEQASFKKQIIDNVKVDAEAIRGVDIQLEVGGIEEVVTVESDNAPLETEDASVRKTVTTEEIQRLPQVNRDPYELARLAPGVFGAGARNANGSSNGLPNTSGPGGSNIGIFATENQVPISANGQRVSSNNFQIDGVSVNSQTWGGAAIITPTQESVKEVQVTSSTYSAEDGRNSGAQIKVVSQNGTNQFHGSAFFKYNDPGWNAFNSGFTIAGTTRTVAPQRVENRDKTFGGSLGGPLPFLNFGQGGPVFTSGKNKLFFFFAYEGLRSRTNQPYFQWIETDQLRNFIVSRGGISSQIVTATGAMPRVISIVQQDCSAFTFPNGNNCQNVAGGVDIGSPAGALGQYFAGNQTLGGGFDGIPDLQYAQLENPQRDEGNQYVFRVDFDATQNDKFAFSLFYTPRNSFGANTAAQSRPMSDINSERLNYNTAFSYIRNFSSFIVNEARVNYTKWGFNEIDSNPNADFGIPRVEVEAFLPSDRLRWGFPRSANTPGTLNERQFNLRDTLTWVLGNHAFKFGAEYRGDVNKNPGAGAARPLYSFSGAWNFGNDTPIFEAITADFNGNPLANNADFNTGGYSFFVQDDWKFRPNLTLNLGLRWEYFKQLQADNLGVLRFGPNGLPDSFIEDGGELTKPDYNNFGPQIGFAWTPTWFDNKMVLRGGFGIGYDRLPNALPANSRANPPNGYRYSICCGSITNPFVGNQILYTTGGGLTSYPGNPNLGGGRNANGGPNIGTVEIYGLDYNNRTPMVYRYSLEVQYEMPWKLVSTLGYQGSRNENFTRIEPLHLTQPVRSTTFNPVYWGYGDVYGYYNGMNARLQRRFSNGFQFDFNYRFSKGLDSYSYEAPCACTNQTYPVDQSTEFGPSDFDVRHFFTLSALWDIPFFRSQKNWAGKILGGWQINTILTRHTGFPWTPVVSSSIVGPNGNTIGPFRPIAYDGTQPLGNSNSNFLSAGGIFPGSFTAGANCNTGTGCNSVFSTLRNAGNGYLNNPPGIGRNVFRGPRYFNVDMSVSKRFGLPNLGVLGEKPNFDLRFNFFNIFNVTNIAPFQSFSNSTRVDRVNFGEATGLLAGRVVEMQLRFSF
ncbi:MAG: TonB-dependent receptor [Pyrinomonadaceae bacterium]